MGVEQLVVRSTSYDVPDVLSRLVELDAKPQIGDGWLSVLERPRAREIRYNHDNTPQGISLALFDALMGFDIQDGYHVLNVRNLVAFFLMFKIPNAGEREEAEKAFVHFNASRTSGRSVVFGSDVVMVNSIERYGRVDGWIGFKCVAVKLPGVTGYNLDNLNSSIRFSGNGGEVPRNVRP